MFQPSQPSPPTAPQPSVGTIWNAEYLEGLYHAWRSNPGALTPEWQAYFQGFELGALRPVPAAKGVQPADEAAAQSKVASLIYAYRARGHLVARLDPLGNDLASHPDLELAAFGLGQQDLERVFDTGHLIGAPKRAKLREIISLLKDIYCRSVGVEYIHIQDVHVRRWLQQQMEPVRNRPGLQPHQRRAILEHLVDAEVFETFLHTRYRGQKRFSLEGAETFIAALDSTVELAPELGVEELVLGMAHRGRLNVLATVLGKPYAEVFTEFEDTDPEEYDGAGDVKYHKGFTSDRTNAQGRRIHLTLVANPSHLEAVDPVVLGKARAKQRQRDDTEHRKKVLPFLVHGDAAFAGQGIVAEVFNLSQLKGYQVGGTIHFIINNQIGFTTLPSQGRSTAYATDVAKMAEAPIFHVNGDDPEAVVFVTELALRFRQEFGRDVVVDMVCYRRHGHNEGDEPAFTQPVMYKKIQARPPVRRLYTERLLEEGTLAADEPQAITDRIKQRLEAVYEQVKKGTPSSSTRAFGHYWEGLEKPFSFDPVPTQVPRERLVEIAKRLSTVPVGFAAHPKIVRMFSERAAEIERGGKLDWGFAELLAFGSLLYEGTPVRLSGQDTERGTFSQRHSVWYDVETQQPFVPLNHLHPEQGHFCVYNSSLSEAAVLGFDYGYSLAEPRMLIAWEAQFGDFANGAQVIFDQFLAAAEAKWSRASGLVVLLPHGYEGQGPEHSNAYLERHLAACADDNWQVCNFTTPAQYFHALRRQQKRPFRKPMIVMAPKSLLRHKLAVSTVAELAEGGFRELLDDPKPPAKARRVVLCSGKVFYDLWEQREAKKISDIALVRVEQLYPLHADLLRETVVRYGEKAELVWAQEEPQNRGAWTFMFPRLLSLFPGRAIGYSGRRASPSPATGSLKVHKQEQLELVANALEGTLT